MANERDSSTDGIAQPVPTLVLEDLDKGRAEIPAEYEGAVARTMFDAPSANDGTIAIVIPREHIESIASQALVRIESIGDGRRYLGAVVAGPFAEPDGLRSDAPVLVSSAAHNAVFMPNYHGRAQVLVLGEQTEHALMPPRRRPRPNSPVRLLDSGEAADLLRCNGEVRLGVVEGLEEVVVRFPLSKQVLPRHLGILGTTGGGKSTTVSSLLDQLQRAGAACVILDREGEYTALHEATRDPRMLEALAARGLEPHGIGDTHVLHLVGREAANEQHPDLSPFSLRFDELSPYAVMEILELSEAQEQRFLQAFDQTKIALDRFKVFPKNAAEQSELLELDELETGYPRMRLEHLYDVIACGAAIADGASEPPYLGSAEFSAKADQLWQQLSQAQLAKHVASWRALQGRLGRLKRLGIFDTASAPTISYAELLRPGRVTVIDLSDVDSPDVNNLTIAQLLRGLQRAQEDAYQEAIKRGRQPVPLVLFIEEAHEFLSAERIRQMPVLFGQVARIARRGRKRWFSLVFITQLPQHLPDEVLGLVNNWALHKIADSNVISRLRRSIGGVDDGLWTRLPNLAPGQAIVSITGHTRPLLTSIDPTPARLLMVD